MVFCPQGDGERGMVATRDLPVGSVAVTPHHNPLDDSIMLLSTAVLGASKTGHVPQHFRHN